MTKKILISLTILVISMSMLIGLVACKSDFGSLPFELEYGQDNSVKRMTGDMTKDNLKGNPNRGFSIDLYMTLDKTSQTFYNTYAFPKPCDHKGHTIDGATMKTEDYKNNEYEKYKDYAPNVVVLTVFLTNFMEEDLSDLALEQVYSLFREFRNTDKSVILKFAYQHGKDEVKPSLDIIKKHMATINKWLTGSYSSSVISAVLSAIRLSFVGEDGSFAGTSYTEAELKDIANEFAKMIPTKGNYYTQAPNVATKNNIAYYEQLINMGFYNDNMDSEINAFTSGGVDKTKKDYKQYVYQSQPNFNSLSIDPSKVSVDGKAVLKQIRDGYFATMNLCALNNGTETRDSILDAWKNTKITKKDLDEMHLPYYAEWFMNADGTSANRSVFDYLRDFLGYNLNVTNLKITKEYRDYKGKPHIYSIIEFTLTNYGMSAPLNIDNFELSIKRNTSNKPIQGAEAITYPSVYDPKLLVNGGQIKFKQVVRGDIDVATDYSGDEATNPGHSIGIRMYERRGSRKLYVRLSNDVPYTGDVNWIYSTTDKLAK